MFQPTLGTMVRGANEVFCSENENISIILASRFDVKNETNMYIDVVCQGLENGDRLSGTGDCEMMWG